MKFVNKIYLTMLVIIIGIITSCSPEVENPIYDAGAFAAFDKTTVNIGDGIVGSGSNPEISIYRGGTTDYNSEVTVNYTISATFMDGSDASSQIVDGGNGTVTIQAGDTHVAVPLTTVGNAIIGDDSYTITLKITSISDASLNIGFPGPDALASEVVINVVDDDCLVNLASSYKNIYDRGTGPVDEADARSVTVTDNGDGSYTISDCLGFAQFGDGSPAFVPMTFTLDAGNNMIIPSQAPLGLDISGSGFFDTCSNTLTYEITDAAIFGTSSHQIIPE